MREHSARLTPHEQGILAREAHLRRLHPQMPETQFQSMLERLEAIEELAERAPFLLGIRGLIVGGEVEI